MRRIVPARHVFLISLIGLVLGLGCGGGSSTGPPPDGDLPLEHYDAGFFSIDKPKGWTIVTSGRCTTFALLAYDPAEPDAPDLLLRQRGSGVHEPGAEGHRRVLHEPGGLRHPLDRRAGGGSVHAGELPCPLAADRGHGRGDRVHVQVPEAARAQGGGGRSSEQHASRRLHRDPSRFVHAGRRGGGGDVPRHRGPKFATFTGNPAGGNGYGYFICGATMPKGEFPDAIDRLVASLNTFTITQGYVQDCLDESAQIWGAVAEAGRTLSEASDILWEGWQQRHAQRGHHRREVDRRLSRRRAGLRSRERRGL